MLKKDAVAIAVHAAIHIPPFTPILVHYGDEYTRRSYAAKNGTN